MLFDGNDSTMVAMVTRRDVIKRGRMFRTLGARVHALFVPLKW